MLTLHTLSDLFVELKNREQIHAPNRECEAIKTIKHTAIKSYRKCKLHKRSNNKKTKMLNLKIVCKKARRTRWRFNDGRWSKKKKPKFLQATCVQKLREPLQVSEYDWTNIGYFVLSFTQNCSITSHQCENWNTHTHILC